MKHNNNISSGIVSQRNQEKQIDNSNNLQNGTTTLISNSQENFKKPNAEDQEDWNISGRRNDLTRIDSKTYKQQKDQKHSDNDSDKKKKKKHHSKESLSSDLSEDEKKKHNKKH